MMAAAAAALLRLQSVQSIGYNRVSLADSYLLLPSLAPLAGGTPPTPSANTDAATLFPPSLPLPRTPALLPPFSVPPPFPSRRNPRPPPAPSNTEGIFGASFPAQLASPSQPSRKGIWAKG